MIFQYAFTHWGSESDNEEWFDKIRKTAEGSQYIQGSCSIKEFDSFYDYTAEKPNVTYTDSVCRVPAMLVLKLLQIEEVEFNLKSHSRICCGIERKPQKLKQNIWLDIPGSNLISGSKYHFVSESCVCICSNHNFYISLLCYRIFMEYLSPLMNTPKTL